METKELQNNTYLFSKKHLTDILNIHNDNLKKLKKLKDIMNWKNNLLNYKMNFVKNLIKKILIN